MNLLEDPALTVIIPAYNEEIAIPLFLPKVIAHCEAKSYNLIIVNDGSTDRSLEILNTYRSSIVSVVSHKVNRGTGAAIKTGITNAKTKYAITIDADGQHYISDIDKLYKEIIKTNSDMVIGSRKGLRSATFFRGLGKLIIRETAKILMPIKIYDLNSGLKIFETEVAASCLHLCSDSFAFHDTITLVFTNYRFKVIEISINIKDRVGGVSTIGVMTAIDTIKEIINMVLLFNPLKIFFPFSMFILFASTAWALPILILGRGLSVGALLGIILGILLLFLGLIAEQISQMRKRTRK